MDEPTEGKKALGQSQAGAQANPIRADAARAERRPAFALARIADLENPLVAACERSADAGLLLSSLAALAAARLWVVVGTDTLPMLRPLC